MGGAENITVAIIKNDKFNKHLVFVFQGLTDFQRHCQIAHNINFINLFWTSNSFFRFSNWKSLYQNIKKNKPSLIQSYMFDASQYARIIGLLLNIPVVIYVVNTYQNKTFKRGLINYLLSFMTAKILVCSDDVRNSVMKFDRISGKKITILPSFAIFDFKVDFSTNVRQLFGIKKRDYVLLFIARLTEQKGIDFLIEAMNICVNIKNLTSIKLIIVGEGKLRNRFSEKIEELHLENNIFLAGEINNLNPYLTQADMYVDSSLWAGLSVAAIKAMEARLPLVMTDVGGARQLTNNGQFGQLCKPRNSRALSLAIELCFKNKMPKNDKSFAYAKKNFSDRIVTKKIIQIYHKILGKR